jgi:membrane protein YqaA with SNARE-associated domain
MFEFLEILVHQYGLFGLLAASFFSSTIFFPIPVEPFLITVTPFFNSIFVVIVASIGSLLGTSVNYGLGFFLGAKTINKKVSKEKLDQAKRLTNRYGWSGLLFIIALPIPGIPVDPITIVPGIMRMNFLEFATVVFMGKLIKYSLFVGLFNELLNLL